MSGICKPLNEWNTPEKTPSGAKIKGVVRNAKMRITMTKRISPIVFPVEVAMINLLIHAPVINPGMG